MYRYKKPKLDLDDEIDTDIEEENILEYYDIERDYRLEKFLSGKSSLFWFSWEINTKLPKKITPIFY